MTFLEEVMEEVSLKVEKRKEYLTWNQYFMALAQVSALRSKDPIARVGACIIDSQKKVIGIGYNGFPHGISDDEFPWNLDENNPLKDKRTFEIHAEMNAILNCSTTPKECILYTTRFPCNECAKFIIQSNIRKVVFLEDRNDWREEPARKMMKTAEIKVEKYEKTGRNVNLNGRIPGPNTNIWYPSGKRTDYIKWEEYFMHLASVSAQRSKDPVTQVGCCIVDDEKQVVGIGYNGFPRGIHDDKFPWGKGHDPLDNKHTYVVHAEQNAIVNANKLPKNCTLYTTLFPCNECAKLIIQSGIRKIVYLTTRDDWCFKAAKIMMETVGMELENINMIDNNVIKLLV